MYPGQPIGRAGEKSNPERQETFSKGVCLCEVGVVRIKTVTLQMEVSPGFESSGPRAREESEGT